MVHGPCGDYKVKCACMKDRLCSKRFPKDFNEQTSVDDRGFPIYHRRDLGYDVRNKGTVKLDNRWVLLHCLRLLKRF